ncbi:hypothetical protein KSP40_PGU003448 [Platanthera guangdongensis]|uniref:Uncharacterized protein n=1 Tax=Platanthera guangdongensis TaxID=2320717 RepID=A0ABR2M6P1_9ASPA
MTFISDLARSYFAIPILLDAIHSPLGLLLWIHLLPAPLGLLSWIHLSPSSLADVVPVSRGFISRRRRSSKSWIHLSSALFQNLMAPKRTFAPGKLFVSRDNSLSKDQHKGVSRDPHVSTSNAHKEPLHDPISTHYFSTDEISDEDQRSDQEAVNLSKEVLETPGTNRSKKLQGVTTCKDIHLMPSNKVILLERNKHGQFVGSGTPQLSSFLGTLARNTSLFSMTPLSWTHVSQYSKETVWTIVKVSACT